MTTDKLDALEAELNALIRAHAYILTSDDAPDSQENLWAQCADFALDNRDELFDIFRLARDGLRLREVVARRGELLREADTAFDETGCSYCDDHPSNHPVRKRIAAELSGTGGE